jgi:hypothetical protein
MPFIGVILSALLGAKPMPYERQNEIQKELDARIPRWLRGGPQNTVRQIVFNQRLHGKSFDESVEIAVALVRQQHPDFTPKILPLLAPA